MHDHPVGSETRSRHVFKCIFNFNGKGISRVEDKTKGVLHFLLISTFSPSSERKKKPSREHYTESKSVFVLAEMAFWTAEDAPEDPFPARTAPEPKPSNGQSISRLISDFLMNYGIRRWIIQARKSRRPILNSVWRHHLQASPGAIFHMSISGKLRPPPPPISSVLFRVVAGRRPTWQMFK